MSEKDLDAPSIVAVPVIGAAAANMWVPSWQPISTAPKDGTEVLGYFPRRLGALYAAMSYVGRGHPKDSEWFSPNASDSPPTHWMPLPEPPK